MSAILPKEYVVMDERDRRRILDRLLHLEDRCKSLEDQVHEQRVLLARFESALVGKELE